MCRRFCAINLAFLIAIVVGSAFAQGPGGYNPIGPGVDLAGNWGPVMHEDQHERGPGPELANYLGLPINDLVRYAVLVICAVGICCGTLSRSRTAWLVAVAAVVASVIGQILWAAPRIDEGHNVFLIDTRGGGSTT